MLRLPWRPLQHHQLSSQRAQPHPSAPPRVQQGLGAEAESEAGGGSPPSAPSPRPPAHTMHSARAANSMALTVDVGKLGGVDALPDLPACSSRGDVAAVAGEGGGGGDPPTQPWGGGMDGPCWGRRGTGHARARTHARTHAHTCTHARTHAHERTHPPTHPHMGRGIAGERSRASLAIPTPTQPHKPTQPLKPA